MSLPFLKAKQEGSTSETAVKKITTKEDSDFDSLEVAAQDILDAVTNKDTKSLAAALRAAFELLDSQPHEEGEHI